MTNASSSSRWITLTLVVIAVAVAVALFLVWRGLDEAAEGEGDAAETSEAEESYEYDPDGGPATRRIKENCDPVAEAKKYEEFIDRRALAILSWNNLPERAAKLKIPVYVTGVDDGAITIGILEIPMREQYVAIWMGSGHIQPGPGSSFLLDPCSARIEAWEAMDRIEGRGTDQGAR